MRYESVGERRTALHKSDQQHNNLNTRDNGYTIALFSTSEQTHCTLAVRDSEGVTVALHSVGFVVVVFISTEVL